MRSILNSLVPILAGIFLIAASAPLRAQLGLSVDGTNAAVVELGDDFELEVTGPVGSEVLLLVDALPGSVTLFGTSIPVPLSPASFVLPLGAIPAGGSLTFQGFTPRDDAAHSVTIYLAAIAFVPGSGLAAAGADFTLTSRPQLAGRTLIDYPHFETTSAVNRGEVVELGVDPRFAVLDGVTADVFVVQSRTRSEWDANPTLTDVRGPMPQAVTFASGATSITAWTFTLDNGALLGPDETPGSGDTRIGVGYDVVIDIDRDGVFDDGLDLIDGYDDEEAGFYIVRDTVLGGRATGPAAGPYAVTEALYSGGSFLGQDLYYPTNIASLGQLPLVVVSHGNGHDYRWYDHIGYHLASYGYVVMSHQNNTIPGSHTAATTTLTNTDWFLGNLGTIAGGALAGHVDSSKIVWIGHSRGADGVARAYDRLFNGAFTPSNFTINDIILVSSIAPVDFGGFAGQDPILGGFNNGSNPHGVPFHLWVGQADADVNGCPGDAPAVNWYQLHERATGARQSISLYGVGHADFHNGGTGSVASGPNLIGRPTTHDIMRGYLLPLVSWFVRGEPAARDFLWRQYESFRPVGAPTGANIVANLMFRDAPGPDRFVLDDFQDQLFVSPAIGTSGAFVSLDVTDFVEGRVADANFNFSNDFNDPFNGFTYDNFNGEGEYRSDSFGCVFGFDGGGDRRIEYDLSGIVSPPDFGAYRYLSFRAAQQTRHPLTTIANGDLTFTVTLEDASGTSSSIGIGAYGGGIEEPYQRNSGPNCGSGLGWTSEYETIRIPVADFLNDASGLDLKNVRKLIFQFGPSHGSPQGRLGLDEIELTNR
jgi:hypothetical protein